MTLLSRKLSLGARLAIALASSAGTMLTPVGAAWAAETNQPRDFSGMWSIVQASGEQGYGPESFLIGSDVPYKPEVQDLVADRMEAMLKEGRPVASAHLMCRPTGVQGMTAPKEGILIMQASDRIAVIAQKDREVRRIYIGGSHPQNLGLTYTGNSVGRWDGNTLVVDTIGYNDKGQLDEVGSPQSTQLHVVERITKSADDKILTDEVTITDPVNYTQPFTVKRVFRRSPGARILDFDCADNPRSDDFANFTFKDDWFKPVCVLPVKDNVVGDKVICTPRARAKGTPSSNSSSTR